MCILQDCEDPTTAGVWWRDDEQWCLYSASHQAQIRKAIADNLQQIDLGIIVSLVHPNGARYVLSFRDMEQTAVSSGQKRPVMVVDAARTKRVRQDVLLQPISLQRRPGRGVLPLHLHFRDSHGNLQRDDSDIENQLLQCMASGSQRTLLVPDGLSGYYFFDLEAMEQLFVWRIVNGEPVLSDKPALQIIAEVPWDAASKMMAGIAAKSERTLRRKVLVMVVERFRSSKNLDALLSEKAAPREVVTTRITTCSTELYEKFVDSLEVVLQRFPEDRMGDIIRTAGKEDSQDMPLQIAFKPAERSNATKTAGKSSRRRQTADGRRKTAFWISMAAPLAAAHAVVYGAVQLEILAYLLIVPDSVWKQRADQTASNSSFGLVELERPEHGLPLAQVSVRLAIT